MVQLVALGLIGALGWYAYNALKKHMAAIGEELEKSEKSKKDKTGKTASSDELELGPDGVYRLKNDKAEDRKQD